MEIVQRNSKVMSYIYSKVIDENNVEFIGFIAKQSIKVNVFLFVL